MEFNKTDLPSLIDDDDFYLIAGSDADGQSSASVWKSVDLGITWTEVMASGPNFSKFITTLMP